MSSIAVAPISRDSPPKPSAGQPFLTYLEGCRGFFGLYIALAHAWIRSTGLRPELLPFTPFVDHFRSLSQPAVAMFLVMSGFVLGLPVARRGQKFSGGFANFAKKRALRILPAYYAALLVAIPISFLTAAHFHEGLTLKRFLIAVALHVTMLHDLSNSFIETIDGPMWSIAVEADIYVLFPLLLVPIARRFGFFWMIAASLAVGLIPTMVGALHHQYEWYPLSLSCFWYIGLFGVGYAAANITVDQRPAFRRLLERVPWQPVAAVLLVVGLASVMSDKPWGLSHRWINDIFVGSAIAAQFVADAQARLKGRQTWFERFFKFKPMFVLGTFSYSFYLLHWPFIDLFLSFERSSWSDPQVVATAFAGVVAALLFSYFFYLAVERPFMSDYRRRGDAEGLHSSSIPVGTVSVMAQKPASASSE